MPSPDTDPEVLAAVAAAEAETAELARIEAALKRGESYDDHLEALDALLGTTMEARDQDVESSWEQSYEERRNDSPSGDVSDLKKRK